MLTNRPGPLFVGALLLAAAALDSIDMRNIRNWVAEDAFNN